MSSGPDAFPFFCVLIPWATSYFFISGPSSSTWSLIGGEADQSSLNSVSTYSFHVLSFSFIPAMISSLVLVAGFFRHLSTNSLIGLCTLNVSSLYIFDRHRSLTSLHLLLTAPLNILHILGYWSLKLLLSFIKSIISGVIHICFLLFRPIFCSWILVTCNSWIRFSVSSIFLCLLSISSYLPSWFLNSWSSSFRMSIFLVLVCLLNSITTRLWSGHIISRFNTYLWNGILVWNQFDFLLCPTWYLQERSRCIVPVGRA